MTHDPKLVDAVRYYVECEAGLTLRESHVITILEAIDAATDEHGKRIAWVAPEAMTQAMIDAVEDVTDWSESAFVLWDALRDACLAKHRGEGR